jgi:UDP-2,3-diacylglucosamine hydrolase
MNLHSIQAQTPPPKKLVALFASDIHLRSSLPHTCEFFFDFLTHHAIKAKQLYLLGDLFEYWAGDDDMATPFHEDIVQRLKRVSDSGTTVFWIPGNRDFLIGKNFLDATGMHRLDDPSELEIAGLKIIVSHGDAYCTDDVAYMQFRSMVRQEQWQHDFLMLPLLQRKAIIQGLRKESQSEQKDKTEAIMDVNQDAIKALFIDHQAQIIIHGHTHRPAKHRYNEGVRYVLPDWECDASDAPRRGGWLSMHEDGQIHFHHLDGSVRQSSEEASFK